eukprot:EG_transcript_14791
MAATTRRRQGTSQATRSGSAPSPTAAKAAPASKPGAAAGKKRSRARVANGKTRGTADEAASTVPVPPTGFYFDTWCDAAPAPNKKKAARPQREPWRGPRYSSVHCGEDSFLCSQSLLAVADGVSAWHAIGVDPALFPNALLKAVQEELARGATTDPVALMSCALEATRKEVPKGSCACTIAHLDPASGILHTATMGDCSLLVVRQGTVVHRTQEMVFGFDTPYLLTTDPLAPAEVQPAASKVYHFQTQPNDIVVVASDGLFDNMQDTKIVEVLTQCKGQSPAQALKEKALAVSQSPEGVTPFAVAAYIAGFKGAQGGHPDDITVIVGLVRQRP